MRARLGCLLGQRHRDCLLLLRSREGQEVRAKSLHVAGKAQSQAETTSYNQLSIHTSVFMKPRDFPLVPKFV